MPRKIPEALQARVRLRARYLCEYCHTNERWQYVRFTMDHTVTVSEGGDDEFEILALACFPCNRRRSDKQTAIDPETGQTVPLFNPRLHKWADHFIWSVDQLRIIPLTTIGRATVHLLDLNRDRVQAIRSADVVVDRHPPADDPIQESK